MKSLAIDLISIDGGTQFRATTNDAKVTEYAELLASATDWPFDTACDVFFDGVNYYLVDGFHRYLGAQRANRASLSCNIHKGSLRDAIAFALKANARHGLHRTNEDKRKAVTFVLADAEWSKLSSRAIAEMCGVSNRFVEDQRKLSTVNRSQCSEKRIGKDGRQMPASQPKPKQTDAPETEPDAEVYTDVEDAPETTVAAQPKATSTKPNPEALAAPIQAVATRLDAIVKDLEKLADDCGGEWLEMGMITDQAKQLKHLIRSGVFWVACPDCNGKGCQGCKQKGWLSRARKSFLTQSQKDKLGVN